jgi:hypothetical protein
MSGHGTWHSPGRGCRRMGRFTYVPHRRAPAGPRAGGIAAAPRRIQSTKPGSAPPASAAAPGRSWRAGRSVLRPPQRRVPHDPALGLRVGHSVVRAGITGSAPNFHGLDYRRGGAGQGQACGPVKARRPEPCPRQPPGHPDRDAWERGFPGRRGTCPIRSRRRRPPESPVDRARAGQGRSCPVRDGPGAGGGSRRSRTPHAGRFHAAQAESPVPETPSAEAPIPRRTRRRFHGTQTPPRAWARRVAPRWVATSERPAFAPGERIGRPIQGGP